MLLFFITAIIMSLSFSIMLASSPLSLGLWVLSLALAISCMIAFMFSSWFAMIIFLIYIGGMLVMFAYFTALMPNQPLEMLKMISALGFTLLPISVSIFPLNSLNPISFSNYTITPTLALYYPSNIPILLFMALVLFFILVAVVKVANIFSGPLRPFNYV
uniref:NADH dehydrogenase subunit 6 n=1 Tax=Euthalenessa festiva TaxID=2153328 RepID=A0A343W6J8_9ANNE|nr:NADH dehydrogenase subunit 6 [Euthalenessa festiva]